MVPAVGLEPTRYPYHGILSPARLPIPPRRRKFEVVMVKKNGVADWTRTSTVSHMPLKHARLPFRHSHIASLLYLHEI